MVGENLHAQVHLMMSDGGVCFETDVVLVEPIITLVGQCGRDSPALCIEHIQVEVHALAQAWHGILFLQALAEHGVLDVNFQMSHPVDITWMHLITQAQTIVPYALFAYHMGIQVSHSAYGLLHIVACAHALKGVVDDRRFTQPAQETVEAACAVGSRKAIYR